MIVFSHPWALLLVLPAAWLLWRSRRPAVRTHAVANLFLWVDTPLADGVPPRDRRPAPPWLTWLQAAVLVALALAVAAPSRPGSQPAAALVLDVSASMAAHNGDQPRIAQARTAARTWLATLPSARSVRLIASGATPRDAALAPAGSPLLASALDALNVTDDAGNLPSAIESARRQTAGEIAVFTDLAPPPDTSALGVRWQQVGAPVDNVAITALARTDDGGAILEITNFGGAERRAAVDITGGILARHELIQVPAGDARRFALPPGPNRTLTVGVRVDGDAGNALASDDRRTVDVGPRSAVLVNVVGNDPMVLTALGSLSDVDLSTGTGEGLGRQAGVLVCTRACTPGAGVSALVFEPGGPEPVIRRDESGGVRRVFVAADLGASWPLTPAFPVFVADAIDWISNRTVASLTTAHLALIAESETRTAAAPALGEVALLPEPPAPRSQWFALAVLALLGLTLDIALRRRGPGFRSAAAALIVAATTGVSLPLGTAGRSAVISLDASASVAGNQRAVSDRVRQERALAGADDRVEVVRFGGTATDIASGLRAARATLARSGDRRILLVTDGQQTSGDAAEEARAAGAAGIPIDVVPIDSRSPAFIGRVDAPVEVRAGAPVPVRTTLKGQPDEIVGLALTRDGEVLDSRRVVLSDSGQATVVFTDRPPGTGVVFYRAILSDDRLGVTLSESGAAVSVTGRGRVLVISTRGAFARLIRPDTFNVVEVTPAACPISRDGLASYSAIVLDAVAPHELTARQLDAIAGAVAIDGAGLLLLGSRDSLDASEFPAGAFAETLPIDFTMLPRPPSKSTSLALLVDISGSMASASDGVTKISAARDAIARALAVVAPQDAIEVIGFASQPVVVVGPADARDAVSVAAKLKALSPSGSTALAPAVRDAVAWLKTGSSQRRRLLLVTDGKTSMSDAEATRAAVRGQSIEVSVVTIGNDAEREWLTELAASTGGRAYFPDRLSDLAREVARETARGDTGRDVNERFTVRGVGHPLAPGDPAPALGGYIAGRLRDGASSAWKSRTDDAVLAAWPRGLGRVVVFSSDLDGPWGAPLRAWPLQAKFWQRTLQWVARSSDTSDIDAELALTKDGPRFVVELAGARAGSDPLPTVHATISGPSNQGSALLLHAVTPTRFEAPAALSEAGDYRATISVSGAPGSVEHRSSRGWYWTGDLESQLRGPNVPLLEDIARASGGRLLPAVGATVSPDDTVFAGARSRGRVNGVPWCMLAALALLSFDYIRRAAEVQ